MVSSASVWEKLTATVSGSGLKVADHSLAILLVNAVTGVPVSLDYGLATKVNADASGVLQSVELSFDAAKVPAAYRVYLMVDTYAAARAVVGGE